MLRKRSRTVQKEQNKVMIDSSSPSDSFCSNKTAQKVKNTSFFSVPRLFVGFSTKCLSDCDAVRSPTSPLDYRVFSSLGSSFLGSPRSPGLDSKPKCWDNINNSRVGLGLVDSLDEENKPCGKVYPESKKSILFVPQMRINILSSKSHLAGLRDETQALGAAPRSLPKDYGILSARLQRSVVEKRTSGSKVFDFDCREPGILRSCSADISGSSLPASRFLYHRPKFNSEVLPIDSKNFVVDSASVVKENDNFDNFDGSIPVSVDSSRDLVSMLSASDIEQSEDYTCVISHGPNPKTTRIFVDFIIESHGIESPDSKSENGTQGESSFWMLKSSEDSPCSSTDDFLSFCFSCHKKLEEGKDIYMYRGEKAFCSCDCRDREILIEEEMDKGSSNLSDSAESVFHEEMFLEGLVMAS